MTAPGSTADVTVVAAREELGKFFAIASMATVMPGMFSRYIDEEWHRFAETQDFAAFCEQTAGVSVRHDPTCGEGVISWVEDYHDRFGTLPAIWFADATGAVDIVSYDAYLSTRTVTASWNCSADSGGDGDDFVAPAT